jgi:hypothetical protein
LIKSRRTKRAGLVARMGAMRNAYTILVESLKEKEIAVDRRIILKKMLKKWGVRIWVEFISVRIGSSGRLV